MARRESRIGIALMLGAVTMTAGCRACSKTESGVSTASSASSPSADGGAIVAAGLGAPIAAVHTGEGAVLVAGLDAAAKAILVERIDAKDHIGESQVILGDVEWSPDAELRLFAHGPEGAFVTWRGPRGGKPVRQLVRLDARLAPQGEPSEVPVGACATRSAAWFSDGARATSRAWGGATSAVTLPKDRDSSLLCGAEHAFAVVEDEDRTSVLPLGASGSPIEVLREKDFGADEQRELAEYTVGDDVGFVRLGATGAVAIREVRGGTAQPIHRLKTSIPKDDDLVAVDASPEIFTAIYVRDASGSCPPAADRGDTLVAQKILALRVRRDTFEESTVELATTACGHELGPFFTGAIGSAVSIAWTERAGGAGKARAPIVLFAHTRLAPTGGVKVNRIEEPADALVDAGCDETRCYAVALARREGAARAAPASLKVLRY